MLLTSHVMQPQYSCESNLSFAFLNAIKYVIIDVIKFV